MIRFRKSSARGLRGSVTQNHVAPTVRLSPHTRSGRGTRMLRLGAVAIAATLMTLLGAWLWHIGWPQRQMDKAFDAALVLTQKAHFAVADIQIEGRKQTSKEALSAAINTTAGAPILVFDPVVAQARIAKLPWVDSVVVERRLPDTIFVRLVERVPLARWQMEGRTVVIDMAGVTLPDARAESFANLPLVVGAGAAAQAKNLLEALEDEPAVAAQMAAAVWVGLRRWDLHLSSKIVAKMPEGNLANGLKRLEDVITDQKALERGIIGIDLRFPDRIIMESDGAATNRPVGDSRP